MEKKKTADLDCVSLEEINQEKFSEIFDNSGNVLFLGSAISLWNPSSIPTGQHIRRTIYKCLGFEEILDGDHKDLLPYLSEILERFPFELLMDRCPIKSRVKEILFDFFRTFHNPNPVHKQLASMFIEGKVEAIITPNYDTCLEEAIYQLDPSYEFVKVSLQEHMKTHFSKNVIFKIHGSVDDSDLDSIIFMMRQEGRLDDWKRILFRNLISGKNILVIGYSGFDFDICPEIPLAKPNKIYWNFLSKEDISLNAIDVSQKIGTRFLIGDMRELINKLGYPVNAEFGKSYAKHLKNLETALFNEIPDMYKKLWRLKIFNSISFNEIVIQESKELIDSAPTNSFLVEVLSEKATALSNGGWYQQAALVYEEATMIAKKNGLERDYRVKSDLAAHSWLAHGKRYKYWEWNRRAKRATQRAQVNYGVESNQIQSLRDWYRLLKKWKFPFFTTILREHAHSLIEELGPKIHKQGNWHGINRLQKLAADFDIPLNNISIIGEYDLNPVELGYHQVAMPIGQMIAYRKSVEISETSNSENLFNYGKYLLRQAIVLGIYAEVWKLSVTLDAYFDKDHNHSNEFWLGFNKCEYSKSKRRQYFDDASKKVDYLDKF